MANRNSVLFSMLLILFWGGLPSCSHQEYDDEFINRYVGSYQASNCMIVFESNDSIYVYDNGAMEQIVYPEYYSNDFPDYHSFLEHLLNEPYAFDFTNHKYLHTRGAHKQTRLGAEYLEWALERVDKYTDESGEIHYQSKFEVREEQNLVDKIMFDNNYYLFINDYSGHTVYLSSPPKIYPPPMP